MTVSNSDALGASVPGDQQQAELRFTPVQGRVNVQVMLGEEEISRLSLHDLPLLIDGQVLRMGGIGGVQTRPEHRKHGYAQQLLSGAVRYMKDNGYDVAMLFGIANFYHRFGFITTLIESKITIPTRLAENAGKASTDDSDRTLRAPRRIRPYDQARDLQAVLSIYSAKSGGQRGCLARQAEGWWGFRLGSVFGRGVDVKVLVEGEPDAEHVVGYFALDQTDEDVIVPEVEAVDGDGLKLILAHLAELAIERRLGQVTFFIHPESDMARLLRFFGADVSITYNFDRGSMARVINLESTLQKLSPVLGLRLASALGPREAGNARLVIAIWDANSARPDLAAATWSPAKAEAGAAAAAGLRPQAVLIQAASDGLKITGLAQDETREVLALREAAAGVPVLALPQELFTQLLFGYHPAADILSEPSVRVTPRLTPVIEALFPAGMPYMTRVDRF
jgi:predicted acetyltransferase